MQIRARPLHDHPVRIVPAPTRRTWSVGAHLFDDPTLQASTSRGWDLLCPYTFEASWNGGPAPQDIAISGPGFVQSYVGNGILSFESGYEFLLSPGHDLWIRGPTNHPKDGLQPLDQVVEADLLPYIGTVHWVFTRPGQTVRFERNEPCATLLPYPAGYIESFDGQIVPTDPAELPAVSCICPTYGRPALLEKAIESFLRQDYAGPKELLVLNDCPEQQLVLAAEHPEVRIVNLPARFRTLGEKLNAGIGLARYDLLFPWLDDDISLPHRLSFSLARLDPARGFFKARTAFYWNDCQVSGPERNVFHGGSCYTRELFLRAGGYPAQSGAVDQAFEAAITRARLDAAEPTELDPPENYYFPTTDFPTTGAPTTAPPTTAPPTTPTPTTSGPSTTLAPPTTPPPTTAPPTTSGPSTTLAPTTTTTTTRRPVTTTTHLPAGGHHGRPTTTTTRRPGHHG
jgi:uncharacterized protein DUF6065/glycosyl transferase family 2